MFMLGPTHQSMLKNIMEKPCMKQPDTTTSGINGIEMELMLNPIKAQLDDMDKKINTLCEVTLAWNESIDNINRHLTESMEVIKQEIGISSWVDDSSALIDINKFILKSSYEKDEKDEKVIRLKPELFNGGESNDDGN